MASIEDDPQETRTLAVTLAIILADVQRLFDGDVAESELWHLVRKVDESIEADALRAVLVCARGMSEGLPDEPVARTTEADGGHRWRAHPALAEAHAGLPVHPAVLMLLHHRFAAAIGSDDTDRLTEVFDQLRTAASVHPSAARAAAIIGGQMLQAGEEAAAGLLLFLVMEYGEDELAAAAAIDLIRFLRGRGEIGKAADVLFIAVNSRYADRIPGGKLQLGKLLLEAERREEAFEVLREVASGTGTMPATRRTCLSPTRTRRRPRWWSG
jgi:hypothetical protein